MAADLHKLANRYAEDREAGRNVGNRHLEVPIAVRNVGNGHSEVWMPERNVTLSTCYQNTPVFYHKKGPHQSRLGRDRCRPVPVSRDFLPHKKIFCFPRSSAVAAVVAQVFHQLLARVVYAYFHGAQGQLELRSNFFIFISCIAHHKRVAQLD